MMGIEPHPVGLPNERFCDCVIKYAKTQQLNPEIIEFMNLKQQVAINEVKKSYNRLKYKYEK